jgi:outer membrane murein-binding lipoprotein Lpp
MNTLAKLAAAAAALVTLAGCSNLEPWVKPYERDRLASPLLNWQRDRLSDKHFAHVREVREGERGATAVQGGGCGCN